MYIILIIFLSLIPSNMFSHPKFSKPPFLLHPKEIHIHEKFTIISEVGTPDPCPEDFKWADEDDWQLTSYPHDAIALIKTHATAPDRFGGNLFQSWTLKAIKVGKFELKFQRYSERISLTIDILDF